MPEFVTEAEVKAWLNDPEASSDLISILIPSASEAVEDYCGREFTPTENQERTLFYNGSGVLSLAPSELRALDSIAWSAEGGLAPVWNAWDVRHYGLRGRTKQGTYLWLALPRLRVPTFDPLPGPAVGWNVRITGDWGCAEVPAAVKTATLIVIRDQMQNPGGGAVQDEVGGVTYSESEGGVSPHIPDDAKGWLEPFMRDSGVGI
jgi:hypothetical protein